MDSIPRSVPADRLARIEAILERARQLSAAEIPLLALAYRGKGGVGEQHHLERERPHKRDRALSIATARSGLSRQADLLQDSAASAVRSAAEMHGKTDRLRTLGLLFDAELAAADAALAVLLEDHLSEEMAGLLRKPFEQATTGAVAAGSKPAGQ